MRFKHLAIDVVDRERSRAFYERFFGFLPGSGRNSREMLLSLLMPTGFIWR